MEGVTIVDSMLAAVVVCIAIVGLLEIFAYGRVKVEQMGIRRQALAALQSEMECYRQQWFQEKKEKGVESRGTRNVLLKSQTLQVPAAIEPALTAGSESGLPGKTVTLQIHYKLGQYEDSLGLSTCFYFPQ